MVLFSSLRRFGHRDAPRRPRDESSTFRLEKLRTCPDIWSENAGGFADFEEIDYGVCLEVRDDDGPGRPTEFMGHCVRSRRPAVLRCLHAIGATRVHQTRSWVVSFGFRAFGPRSDLRRC